MKLRSSLVIVFTAALFVLAGNFASANAEGVFGGTAKFAVGTEQVNLDVQISTTDPLALIAQHMFEQLFTFDAGLDIVPMLAESYEVNDEGTVYTIYLRKGVPFHNGKEMTSEDVVASLQRWGNVSSRGGIAFEFVTAVEAVDDYTVVLRLAEPFAPLLSFLAFHTTAAAIFPKEIVEEYPTTPIAEYIGTGPYKFVHWLPDYRIRLERFEDYAARDDEPSGWGGKKVAYFDRIEFYPVLEPYTRQAGVQAGDYHLAETISRDNYPQLAKDPAVNTHMVSPAGFMWVIFNQQEGIMTSQALREAVVAALDMEPILAGSYGAPEFYDIDTSYYPNETIWYTDAGNELYDQNNIARAKELMEAAGYNQEPIRLVSVAERVEFLNLALVVASQWEAAGFNVDLQLYDWSTYLDRRAKPQAFDAFVAAHAFVPDPSLITILSESYPGWWDSPTKRELLARFQSELDREAYVELWSDVQRLIYEEAPCIRVGGYNNLMISVAGLQNFEASPWPFLWNVWLEN